MATRFADWLIQELEKRDWSQSDLSRNAKISTSQITRILNGQRNAGEDVVKAIAHAFQLPPEQVFRSAGLLPESPQRDEALERINHLYNSLKDPTNRSRALEFLLFLTQQEGKNGRKKP